MFAVHVGEDLAHLGTEDPFEGHRRHLDHGDVVAELAGGGCDLGADEPGTHHHDPAWAIGQLGPDGQAVVESPQGEHPGEALGTGDGATARTGGDDQPVEGDLGAVAERHSTGVEVETGGGDAEYASRREFVE